MTRFIACYAWGITIATIGWLLNADFVAVILVAVVYGYYFGDIFEG